MVKGRLLSGLGEKLLQARIRLAGEYLHLESEGKLIFADDFFDYIDHKFISAAKLRTTEQVITWSRAIKEGRLDDLLDNRYCRSIAIGDIDALTQAVVIAVCQWWTAGNSKRIPNVDEKIKTILSLAKHNDFSVPDWKTLKGAIEHVENISPSASPLVTAYSQFLIESMPHRPKFVGEIYAIDFGCVPWILVEIEEGWAKLYFTIIVDLFCRYIVRCKVHVGRPKSQDMVYLVDELDDCPAELRSDWGTEFSSHEFGQINRVRGIQHYMVGPGLPQLNGVAESAIKHTKRTLREFHTHQKMPLEEAEALLAEAVEKKNHAYSSALGVSPVVLRERGITLAGGAS